MNMKDVQMGLRNGIPLYTRTTTWKCERGHINTTGVTLTALELRSDPLPKKDESVKRFHRKGFKGHKVGKREWTPMLLPDMTNHERMLHRARLRVPEAEVVA
jgi:hypothetical protein